VKKLYVDAGDRVKAGQLLAELDKEQIEAQVRQARAALEAPKPTCTRRSRIERAKLMQPVLTFRL